MAELRNELGQIMDRYCAVFREAEGLNAALEIVQRLQEEYKDVAIDDRGTISTRTCSERSSSATCSTARRRP